MKMLFAILGIVLLLPSAVLSKSFSVDLLYEIISERSSPSHSGINLSSELANLQSDTSNIKSDSLKDSNQSKVNGRNIEPFPILSYDTDTKFGYGAKLFLFNLFKIRESFDMVHCLAVATVPQHHRLHNIRKERSSQIIRQHNSLDSFNDGIKSGWLFF